MTRYSPDTLERALSSWLDLNAALMKRRGKEGLQFAQELLKMEQEGKSRPEFLRRIVGRVTRLSSQVAREDLARRIQKGRSRRQ